MLPLWPYALALLLQASSGSREERVLALLGHMRALGGGGRYRERIFARGDPSFGGRARIDRLQWITCGNSDVGTFDDELARRFAVDLCAIYGLVVEMDRLEAEGEHSAVLDGFDPRAQVGFELEGTGCRETFCAVEPEGEATALSSTEYAWLAAKGYRLHVDRTERYRTYGDEFTAMLAYAAGLVRFLNEVTPGEDVELGGLLFETEAAWEPLGSVASASSGIDVFSTWIHAESAGTVRVACRGLADFGSPRDQRGFFVDEWPAPVPLTSAHGAPTVLVLGGSVWDWKRQARPEFRLRVRQRIDGVDRVHESRTLALFLPSSFDLAREFELELELAPGQYEFPGPARIGAAGERR